MSNKIKIHNIGGMSMAAIPLPLLGHMPTKNPNVMGPEREELLSKSIDRDGFLQPILVVKDGDAFTIVDGEHRVERLAELGHTEVPAVIAPNADSARRLRIALNKLRGELDLSLVAQELVDLSASSDLEELTLTGFLAAEVSSLLDMMQGGDEDDILSGTPVADVDAEVKPKTYNLVLKFQTESERAKVKEALEDWGDSPEQAIACLLKNGEK